ncbi:MAG: efflux transporter outer membrane subunit [Magnetospirillum sp.]|nr:efflux transporter outer membrane subunit [Magnetospirillum sp.]
MAFAALLSACSFTPELAVPAVDLPAGWANGAAGDGAALPAAWWTEFASPELDALIAAAFAHNHDLAAAVARIEQAEAQLSVSGAALLPTLDAGATAQTAKRSRSSTSTSSTTSRSSSSPVSRSYQVSLSASYEIDFWGKTRAGIAAAESSLAASRFDRDTVALTLAADVATAWFRTLALTDRVAVARSNLAIARQTLEVAEKQQSFGKTSGLEAAQQRSAVALIEAQLPALELQRAQAANALAVLTGAAPAAVALERRGLSGIPVPTVPAGLPSALLRRRPDVAAAEARLAAANADIGAARAQLFPTLSLSAERGNLSSALVSLAEPRNIFWTLGSSVAATLFDNGKLRGAVVLSEARMRELAQSYQTAALAALKDVEDGLASTYWLGEQETAEERAVAAAREAQRLAEIRYREGAVDYLTALESQRTLLQAEDGAVQVRQARLDAAVGLFKALGGGFER